MKSFKQILNEASKQTLNECCGFQTVVCAREGKTFDEMLEGTYLQNDGPGCPNGGYLQALTRNDYVVNNAAEMPPKKQCSKCKWHHFAKGYPKNYVDCHHPYFYMDEPNCIKQPEKCWRWEERELKEGVGDKFMLRAFKMPMEKEKVELDIDERPYTFIKDNSSGEYIPIFLNPKSLEKFDADVRAIIDEEGNLYVAAMDGSFFHESMAKMLGFHETTDGEPNGYLYRKERTNTFQILFGYYTSPEWIKTAKKKNPQYDFEMMKYGEER